MAPKDRLFIKTSILILLYNTAYIFLEWGEGSCILIQTIVNGYEMGRPLDR